LIRGLAWSKTPPYAAPLVALDDEMMRWEGDGGRSFMGSRFSPVTVLLYLLFLSPCFLFSLLSPSFLTKIFIFLITTFLTVILCIDLLLALKLLSFFTRDLILRNWLSLINTLSTHKHPESKARRIPADPRCKPTSIYSLRYREKEDRFVGGDITTTTIKVQFRVRLLSKMQYTTLSVALFAVLASAHQHPPHHFHRRGFNETGPSTTLTVFATEVHTITSCAVTITDCPNRPEEATSEYVVTETRAITTTVCPVKDASSISSQIASNLPPKPTGTGSGPAVTSDESGPTTDATLTYTLGTGTSTTVVTTTIKHTSTATLYATSTADFQGEGSDGEPTVGSGSEPTGAKDEPTTTLMSTATSTRYVTVYPAPSGESGGSEGSGECGAPCAPVTVTVAASTVTVTETAAASCPTADEGVKGNAFTSTQDGLGSTPTEDAGAAPTDSDVVIVPSTKTVIPVPPTSAPYGNGTAPYPTGAAAPSGFVTKPSY
jgi:hypothetical protein